MPKKLLKKSPYDIVNSSNFPLTIAVFVLFLSLGLASFSISLNKFFLRPTPEVLQGVPASYPIVKDGCLVGGCSGEICADEEMASACIWQEEYACFRHPFAICARQSDGECGWEPNDELLSCFKCTEEGEEMPAVPGYRCCPGFGVINPVQPDAEDNCPPPLVGGSTCAKCGNGVCGPGENKCNCPQDCLRRAKEGEMCGGIIGIICEEGLECIYENDITFPPYPDASGVCRQIPTKDRPVCSAIGTKSEGWYLNRRLIKYDSCQGCKAICSAIGTKSEGWYSSCNQSLIEYALCRPRDCPPVLCELYCQYGFKKDENGCPICECKEPSTEERACRDDPYGSWKQFNNGCADICGAGSMCTQALTMGCDCGIDRCWNNKAFRCEPNDICQYDYDNSHSMGIGDMLHLLGSWDSGGIAKLLGILANWGRGCPEN